MASVVELAPVLHVHDVLGGEIEGVKDGDEGRAEAEEEEDRGVEHQPDVLVRKGQLGARAILSPGHWSKKRSR